METTRNKSVLVFVCRYNLDPLDKHSDEEIWVALEKTFMKEAVCCCCCCCYSYYQNC